MKNFIIYNNLGKILRVGSCLDGDFLYQQGVDEFILEGRADFYTQYIEDGVVKDMPLKPQGEYKFNYESKQWEFDYILADDKARQQRDNLLADGPDRISPMWWSSMTPEQQQAWTDYRQALLDITEQPNYPQEIVWPTKP